MEPKDRWFKVDNDGEEYRVYYSVHSGWSPDGNKQMVSVDIERTAPANSHSYLCFMAICDIASCIAQLQRDLEAGHDV